MPTRSRLLRDLLALLLPHVSAAAVRDDEVATFTLSLHSARPTALADAVFSVSDPGSPRFRKYLTDAQIEDLVAPPASALAAVESWLSAALPRAVRRRGGHGSLVHVNCSAAAAAALFGVELAASGGTGAPRVVRCTSACAPRLPSSVAPYVDSVLGLSEPPAPPTTRPTRPAPTTAYSKCGGWKGRPVDPNVLAKQYEYPSGGAAGCGGAAGSGVSQGVAAFQQAQFRQSDVDAFDANYSLPAVNISVLGPNSGGYYGEASLDTQYITASGPGLPTWFIARDNFDMLAWCLDVLAMKQPPAVLSISWGGGESTQHLPAMRAADQCFQRGALRGLTFLAASGDDGVGGRGGLFSCKKFDVTWPASSPHVTAVGATYLADNGTEVGWSLSGGGFSSVFPRPRWQAAAVDAYVARATMPNASLFNGSGRAVPDVSALGTCYQVQSGGVVGSVSGTSASTPTFAGLLSRINVARVAAGKPTLGLINPVLYAARAGKASPVGTDITQGNNARQEGWPCNMKKDGGFPAAPGFDAITGLGTPLWPVLEALLMS